MRIPTCLTAGRRAAAGLRRAARRLGSALAEMHRQQQRLTTVSLSIDHYLLNADAPPQTYREFLARTAGTLLHEPSARARLAGYGVR